MWVSTTDVKVTGVLLLIAYCQLMDVLVSSLVNVHVQLALQLKAFLPVSRYLADAEILAHKY